MCIESNRSWIIQVIENGHYSVDLHFLIGDGYPLPDADRDVRTYLQTIAGAFPTPKDCVAHAQQHFSAEQIKALKALAAKAGPELDELYRVGQCLTKLQVFGDEYAQQMTSTGAN